MELTIVYVTGRLEPKIEWFLDSLHPQITSEDSIDIIIVNFHDGENLSRSSSPQFHAPDYVRDIIVTRPMASIWQGEHKITKEECWANGNARNTGFALCQTEWVACLDDRCVLMDGWLEGTRRAIREKRMVCGRYQKRVGMEVVGGKIVVEGNIIGEDHRWQQSPHGLNNAPGGWVFGCSFVLPLEWALAVNGFEDGMSCLGMEDIIFGMMLKNSGYRISYDPGMFMVEDRSPDKIGTGVNYLEKRQDGLQLDRPFKRYDKGKSPLDKSHAALTRFGSRTRTEFTRNLQELRLLHPSMWPIPHPQTHPFGAKVENGNWIDWYDGQLVKEM